MLLRDLMGPGAGEDVEVAGLAYDSRSAGPGTLFFCFPGERHDGHDFAPDAVRAGAGALVVERPLGLGVPERVVPSVREAMPGVAARFYGDPTAELEVVGVTGTNGKTTTCFLVRSLLEADGRPCGLLGTVKSVVGGREDRDVARTTPEAIDLQATFRAMVDAGDRACAMEVSSHALHQHRADAIRFDVAVFTNLTQDHLDYHRGGMDEYFAAKRRLFELGPRLAIVNAGDPRGRQLAADFPDALTFGVEVEADYRATDVRFDVGGTSFTARTPDGPLDVRTRLMGRFNVENALAALAAARGLGVAPEVVASALPEAEPVPGRLEPVHGDSPFAVLVDYAHTPDSLENALRTVREIATGRVIVVFGAGGNRDRLKRPLMGQAARELADVVVVTSDNPRDEEPEAIVADVLEGAGPDAVTRVDRREAIEEAIEMARPGDVVLVAGKGHEPYQEFEGGRREHFDDVEVARAALASRNGVQA